MVALVVVEVVRVRNAGGLIISILISFKALVIGAKSPATVVLIVE